jgi:flavodoxin
MSKVLVLYYSSYGHTERMAQAVAEGVREACAEGHQARSGVGFRRRGKEVRIQT